MPNLTIKQHWVIGFIGLFVYWFIIPPKPLIHFLVLITLSYIIY